MPDVDAFIRESKEVAFWHWKQTALGGFWGRLMRHHPALKSLGARKASDLLLRLGSEKKADAVQKVYGHLRDLEKTFRREGHEHEAHSVSQVIAETDRLVAMRPFLRSALGVGAGVAIGSALGKTAGFLNRHSELGDSPPEILYPLRPIFHFGKHEDAIAIRDILAPDVQDILRHFNVPSPMSIEQVSRQTALSIIETPSMLRSPRDIAHAFLLPTSQPGHAFFITACHAIEDEEGGIFGEKKWQGKSLILRVNPAIVGENAARDFLFPYYILAYSKNCDLALGWAVTSEALDIQMPAFSTENKKGSEVYAISSSSPRNDEFTIKRGKVIQQNDSYILTHLELRPGYSGCPLVDAQGAILGFTVGGESKDIDRSISSVHVKQLLEFYLSAFK